MDTTAAITYYENYTPVGDILVLATCMVFAILMYTAYISRTRSYVIFRNMLALLCVAAVSDIAFHVLVNNAAGTPNISIYLLRGVYHLGLFGNMFLYVMYAKEPLQLDPDVNRRYVVIAGAGLGVLLLNEILGTMLRYGFYIDAENRIHTGVNIFPLGYLFFVGLVFYIMIRYRNRIYKQILYGLLATSSISLFVMYLQGRHGQGSFTAATYLFPAYALLYLVHSHPYDIESGAVDAAAFEDEISYHYAKRRELLLMSLYLPVFDGPENKYPKEIQDLIRHFATSYFRGSVLFQISGGHMLLVLETAKNPGYKEKAQKMLADFDIQHAHYRWDYKIVITKSVEEISEQNDYIGLFQHVEQRMPDNEVHFIEEKDIEAYRKYKYIVSQLADINQKRDLSDERVEVFCQPVFNITTGKYDTAEALMRMRLPETGMVFPDQFIPVAEKYHYIHTLSMIILSKTCAQIRRLLAEGYYVKRISVNFSMLDIREPDFCEMVQHIITENKIPPEKVAIELTESQNESDFLVVRDKINELKDSGIKFYLDDFGTGYSSFERIMELPFDIIKFDRSLVIASSSDVKSETMVSYLAHMFSDMNYAVLYEGIENEDDENRCINMCARYLQGYKYSKPIPIEKLTEYFEKRAVG